LRASSARCLTPRWNLVGPKSFWCDREAGQPESVYANGAESGAGLRFQPPPVIWSIFPGSVRASGR
jgi:hypothetical protein